jgi:hypothetical protein
MTPTLESEWNEFNDRILKAAGASQVQITETRRAFYAGAYSVMTALAAIGDDSVSEDEGVQRMESLRRECELFFQHKLGKIPGY